MERQWTGYPSASRRSEDLHGGEGGVVAGDPGEVVLQQRQGPGQCDVPTPAEQGHAREAEDGGHQRGVGHPAQTLEAALGASCRGGQTEALIALFSFSNKKAESSESFQADLNKECRSDLKELKWVKSLNKQRVSYTEEQLDSADDTWCKSQRPPSPLLHFYLFTLLKQKPVGMFEHCRVWIKHSCFRSVTLVCERSTSLSVRRVEQLIIASFTAGRAAFYTQLILTFCPASLFKIKL